MQNKELEGSKEKTSIEDMYPAAPEPVSEYLYSKQGYEKNILEDESANENYCPIYLYRSRKDLSKSHAKL